MLNLGTLKILSIYRFSFLVKRWYVNKEFNCYELINVLDFMWLIKTSCGGYKLMSEIFQPNRRVLKQTR